MNNFISSSFNKKNNEGSYDAYIINRQTGTGTDFPTHPVIEDNGGVRVIICLEPTSYGELCQFRRRTGRMSNKG